ncbi:hypothetical protein BaRGS_00034224 [Batillaria attramentaria]|uniref:Uncharacterized protein n=1 Tax=Batillaria attramentaria TaxID=370345 RepID=A0ABD0JHX3_9CAEN
MRVMHYPCRNCGLAVLGCPEIHVQHCRCGNCGLAVLNCPLMDVLHCWCRNLLCCVVYGEIVASLCYCPCGDCGLPVHRWMCCTVCVETLAFLC